LFRPKSSSENLYYRDCHRDCLTIRLLRVDLERHQVELTMRSRDLSQDDAPMMTIEDLVEGNNVDGIIKKVELYGLFIEIKGTKTSGLCHKSEAGVFSFPNVSHFVAYSPPSSCES